MEIWQTLVCSFSPKLLVDFYFMDIRQWLNQPPQSAEVLSLNKDGSGKYIPYEIIIEKLYQLSGHEWSIYNLNVTYFNLPNRKTLVSGTVEVEVNYEIDKVKIKRVLTGGANFVVNNTRIPHVTASVKSLAVMSTVKPLGPQFGFGLNKDEENPNPGIGLIDTEVKPIMDMVILKKYEKAIKENDLVTINNIKMQYHVED